MSAAAISRDRPAPPVVARTMLGPLIIALGLSLPALGAHGEANTAPDTSSALALLAGVRPGEKDFSVSSGFELKQNTILLSARAGDVAPAQTFILDSGAPMTLSAALLHELGLGSLSSISLAGPDGGHTRVAVTRLPRVTIAGLAFVDVGAVVAWVQPPDELACLSTAGLLGASLLQSAIWQIDFHSRQITATSSLTRLPGLENATRIPFTRADAAGSPRISVGVGNSEALSLLVDLGFNGSLAIPVATLERAGYPVSDTAPVERGQSSSTVLGDRQSEARIARIGELRLGNLELRDFPVFTGTAVSDFHVGIEFLRHFRVTIDWLNNDLYLELRAPKTALYYDYANYGFAPKLEDSGLHVGALWTGSAADRAGLELGDRLVEIDGQNTGNPDFASFCTLLDSVGLFGRKDTPISVTRLRDGKRDTFSLTRTPPGPPPLTN